MIDKTYWKIAFACDPEKTYTELKCKFFSDPDFRNEVLDSIPEDKMKEMRETYMQSSKFKDLTFEEWFDFIRRTGMIIPSSRVLVNLWDRKLNKFPSCSTLRKLKGELLWQE